MFKKNDATPRAIAALLLAASASACYGYSNQGWSGVAEAPPPPPPPEAPPPPPPPAPKLKAKLEITGDIDFDIGKATIRDTPASQGVLNQVLKVLNETPTLTKLRVEGHTDNTGKAADNQKLSAARAASVGAWLIAKGISANRLSMDGCGSKVPLFPNDSVAHKAQNRRTEFHVVELDGGRPEGYTESCTPDFPGKS